ncbi:MAG: hypothetical protein JNL54_13880 [Kineosporiaceae bacterium]|nr:hypothetical protein [Kineosporiaceae bacterium]
MSHKLAARFVTTMHLLRDRREAGAAGLEYAGMVIVAALIVVAVYGAIDGADIAGKVSDAVNKILNGS